MSQVQWVYDEIGAFFSSISSFVGSILGTVSSGVGTALDIGTSIVTAFVSWAKIIYDALIGFAESFGMWIVYGANFIGEWFKSGLVESAHFLDRAFSWIGSKIFDFGHWLYNAAKYTIEAGANIVMQITNALINWVSVITDFLSTKVNEQVGNVNTFFVNIFTRFRSKMLQSIAMTITITMAWKNGTRILNAKGPEDWLMGSIGMLLSPLVGRVVAVIADSVIPTPNTTNFNIIPEVVNLGFNVDPLSLTMPTEPGVPAGALPGGTPDPYDNPVPPTPPGPRQPSTWHLIGEGGTWEYSAYYTFEIERV